MYDLLGILSAFLVLGILVSKKVEFGISMILATVVLLLFYNPSQEALLWVMEILSEWTTINLVLVIVQIGLIGFLYRDSGQIHRIIDELRKIVPDSRMVVASIPAIFGLMPIPGGALVSAPLIDDEGTRIGIDGTHKAFVNWWFRHVWFSIYPLEVGLVLAAYLSGVDLYMIALFNVPIFVAHLIIGVRFGLHGIKKEEKPSGASSDIYTLAYGFLPIVIALSFNMLLSIPLSLTLFAAVLMLLFQNRYRYGAEDVSRIIVQGISTKLFLAGIGIMLFKGIMERSDALSPLVSILEPHIPVLAVAMIGAFTIGVLLGHLPAAVGVGFPVLLPLLPVVNVQTVAMLFLFIMLGYVISPIHLCIVLTLEYFHADMGRFYRMAAPSVLLLVGAMFTWLFVTGTFSLF